MCVVLLLFNTLHMCSIRSKFPCIWCICVCMCVCMCVCEGSRFCIFVGGVLTAGSSSVPAAGNVSLPGSWQSDDIIDFVQYLGVR